MASIKTLFDKITIIHPEKVGLLGEIGLEQELIANVRLFAEEIWNSLPISTENKKQEVNKMRKKQCLL